MTTTTTMLTLLLMLLTTACCCVVVVDATTPVKIFILAGQSNMRGWGDTEHFRELAKVNDEYYAYLDPPTNDFRIRRDVRITFNENNNDNNNDTVGDLSVGYGIPGGRDFGPEVGFGHTVGDALQEPVLLIKVAVGGSSLAFNWRPPSAPNIQEEKAGRFFRLMERMVEDATSNLEKYVPGHGNDGYEIAGFVWLHGWFDCFNDGFRAEYESNLSYLIDDVRSTFGDDSMPFLIGELGQGGSTAAGFSQITEMRQIQQTVADKYDDTVVFVPTATYVANDKTNVTMFWNSTFPHYFERADTIIQIGNAFGREILNQITARQTISPSTSPSTIPTELPTTTSPTISISPSGSSYPSDVPSISAAPSGSSLPSNVPSIEPSPLIISARPSFRPVIAPTETQRPILSLIISARPSFRPVIAPTETQQPILSPFSVVSDADDNSFPTPQTMQGLPATSIPHTRHPSQMQGVRRK
jgi:hypothetical protein